MRKSQLSMQYNKMIITFINMMHNISKHIIYKFLGQNHSQNHIYNRTTHKTKFRIRLLTFSMKFRISQKTCIASIFVSGLDFPVKYQKLHKALILEHNNPINHILSQHISILQFPYFSFIFLQFSLLKL